MKIRSLAAILALGFTIPAFAYDQEDLRTLQLDKKCNGCDLSGANLRGMQLRGAELRWTNLSKANLNGVDLSKADLTGSDLSRARLSQTNFTSAKLQGVQFNGADLSSAEFQTADLRWSLMEHLNIDTDPQTLNMMTAQMEGTKFRNNRRCRSFPGTMSLNCIPDFR